MQRVLDMGLLTPTSAALITRTAALAGGALASTASVDSLAMALAQGGGVANQFGAHLEDTVGTLAMFDQNALRGSDAGTSMKTMLLSLANPSKAAAAAMRNLGINAFTAQGEFVGLNRISRRQVHDVSQGPQ